LPVPSTQYLETRKTVASAASKTQIPETNTNRGVARYFAPCLRAAVVLIIISAFALSAAAENLTGTVTNGTTNKPSAGDDVVLLKLAQGMEEAGRTKTDKQGHFSLALDAPGPHLVRVIHQEVTYHKMAPPGVNTADIEVYDAAKKVTGITTTVDVMRFQTENNALEVLELYAVRNESSPPRTQMNDRNYEIQLPPGAEIDSSYAKSPGGQPVNASAVPEEKKGRYAIVFPLRPGETQFQIAYHVPKYSGQAKIEPHPLTDMQHFVVMLPKSMQFKAVDGQFQPMPEAGNTNVQVITNVKAGESIAFEVSGTGLLPEDGGTAAGGAAAGGQGGGMGGGQPSASAEDRRPGGGLGPPTDAPDPLHNDRWYILGGFAVVLAFGAIYIAKQRPPRVAVAAATGATGAASTRAVERAAASVSAGLPVGSTRAASASGGRSTLLLEALKEELFQLEMDRQQGAISPQEYEKAKAALDQTLQRAVSRSKSK
jgi:hypothetical protein